MKQIGELRVQEYMTQQVITVNDADRLTQAIGVMDDNQLSVVPVIDKRANLIGILSNRDLLEIMGEIQADLGALHHVQDATREFLIQMLMNQGDNTLVSDVMTSPVKTVDADANLVVAARTLSGRDFHHLPVVDGHQNLVGILAASDFVRAIADHGALAAG